jgi:AraC-like DNA-binding protein
MERNAIATGGRCFFISAHHFEEDCIRHLHPSLEIVLVTEGVLTMEISGQEYTVPVGYGIFVPPFEAHLFRSQEGNRYHVLEFSGELVPYFFGFIGTNAPTSHIFAVSPECAALADRLPDTEGEADCIAAQGVLAPLCHEIKEKCGFAPCDTGDDEACHRAISYMCLHFTEPLSLSSVARAVGMHPVTLSKLFADRLGLYFHSYLQYLRCSHALGLIRGGNATLTEVAYSAGFGSIRSFNRAFLAVYGKRPSDYRCEPRPSAPTGA